MTSRAKRLTLILGVAALVAVVAGVAMAPRPADAAKKPSDPDAFTIAMTLRADLWGMLGPFSATGAIDDSGTAVARHPGPPSEVVLRGEAGEIYIDLVAPYWGDFQITGGTDAYTELSGSGTYTFDVRSKKDGTATYRYTLEGTVHP